MNKRLFSIQPWIKTILEYIMVLAVTGIMILSFISPESKFCSFSSFIAGIAGLAYLLWLLSLVVRRPLLDWHLVNGKYILKVVTFVLLMPFMLTLLVSSPAVGLHPEELMNEITQCEAESECATSSQENPNIFWTVYFHFIDAGNQHMTVGQNGRGWAALIGILGVFLLNGLLVSSIIGSVDSRKERWLKGDVRYRSFLRYRRHYVIIGGNDVAEGIVQQLFSKDESSFKIFKPYILIQTSQDVETFRRGLFTNLTLSQQQRVIIYYGNRTSKADIGDLCLGKALEVFVLGEDSRTDDIESYHDTINMECLRLISENISGCSKFYKDKISDRRLVCRVMFEYQTSFSVFKVTDINVAKIKFLPFNYYEKWAQNVLICQETDPDKIKQGKYLPLEGPNGIKSDDSAFVHVIIVGMSRMGIAMAIETAYLTHYPNYETHGKRTRITFVDANADVEKDYFISRFKALFALSHWRYGSVSGNWINWGKDHEIKDCEHLGGDFIDIEWEFLKGTLESSAVQQYIVRCSEDEDARLTIAMCIPENSRAIAAAAYLPDSVYKSNSTMQVLVYQRLNDELVRQISENNGRYYRKIKAFGMSSSCYDSDLVEISESMAGAIGNAYDAYVWGQIVERFNAGALMEDDYKALTDYKYCPDLDTKQEVESLCVEFIKMHQTEKDYTKVKEAQETWIKTVDKVIGSAQKSDKKIQLTSKASSGKTAPAKMWSNHYNIYSMWTKFRSVATSDGHAFNPLKEDFDGLDPEMMKRLGQMEHNRWNVEQLLLRYRPLTAEEQTEAKVQSLTASKKIKETYKGKFAHLDICSNQMLDEIDYKMSELDKALIKVLPSDYRKYLNGLPENDTNL